jgi:outer membrane lipoprotein-sorting protein
MIGSDRSDFVEHALSRLRDASVADGPPAQVLDATAKRLRSLATAGNARPRVPIRTVLFRVARYGAVAVACASVAAGLLWVGLIGHSAAIAFADVQKQVQKVRSVQYMETRVDLMAPNEKELKAVGVKTDVHKPRRYLVLGRYLQRTEQFDSKGQVESVSIDDAKTGKHVAVFPKWRRFVILDSQVAIDFETGQTTEEKIKPAPQADFYSLIREVPADATIRLPAKMLGDKQVVGFVWEQRIEKKKGTETRKRTFWVDPTTKLPIRIESSCCSVMDRGVVTSNWVQSDFVFDKELSESLFSTHPPEGYSIHTEKIYGIHER